MLPRMRSRGIPSGAVSAPSYIFFNLSRKAGVNSFTPAFSMKTFVNASSSRAPSSQSFQSLSSAVLFPGLPGLLILASSSLRTFSMRFFRSAMILSVAALRSASVARSILATTSSAMRWRISSHEDLGFVRMMSRIDSSMPFNCSSRAVFSVSLACAASTSAALPPVIRASSFSAAITWASGDIGIAA